MSDIKVHRALISVSDKTGIVEFATALRRFGVEIISTGGTLKTLRDAGIDARSVSEVTGFPEILDGRVKTLHPRIHGALLAVTDNPTHRQELEALDIESIDMVAVNLYPFEETVRRNGIALNDAVEQIDIGGPAMLRAAAKNYRSKIVITNPARYSSIISELERLNGGISEETRYALASEAFQRTSQYDAAISRYLASHQPSRIPHAQMTNSTEALPATLSLQFPKSADLRYGENPHQQAALYGSFNEYFEKLHGKELSYNNILDIEAAVELVEEFSEPTIVIVKHNNPCGVGSGTTVAEGYEKALATDPKSAFGGIVATNRPLDRAAADRMNEIFTEVIIAPDFAPDVLELLKKKKDRRIVRQCRPLSGSSAVQVRTVAGGLLLQTPDSAMVTVDQLRIVTKRKPTENELAAMMFARRVAKHVKSNAIVYARADRTLGIGAGQMSRFDSSRIAAEKAREAGHNLNGTAVASDAFFPFADGLLEAVKAGATAVIQPGGSIRDQEVIDAADANNIAMAFTGIRHFKH